MLRSLVSQLSSQYPNVPRPLKDLHAAYGVQNREPPRESLLMTLKETMRFFDQTFLIVDALDECSDREELLRTLKDLATWEGANLHILATSRLEHDIKITMVDLHNHKETSIRSMIVDADIRAYVNDRLETDPKLRRFAKHRIEIEDTLMEKADGM